MPGTSGRPAMMVVIAFAIVYIVWGSTYFFIRLAVEHIPPMLVGMLRYLVAGVLMLGWCLIRREPLFGKGVIGPAFVSGFLLLCGGNGILIWTEQYIPSSLAAVLLASGPIWFVLLDRRQWGVNLRSRSTLAGLLVGFVGVLLLFAERLWPVAAAARSSGGGMAGTGGSAGGGVRDSAAAVGSGLRSAGGGVVRDSVAAAGSGLRAAGGGVVRDSAAAAGSGLRAAGAGVVQDSAAAAGSGLRAAGGGVVRDSVAAVGSGLRAVGRAIGEAHVQATGAASGKMYITALVILLIGSISWAAGSLYSKYRSAPVSNSVNAGWQMLLAGLVFLPASVVSGEWAGFHFREVPLSSWLAIGYLVTMGSLAGYSAFVWLLQVRPATQVSTHAYVNPVVAVLLGVLFAGESLSFVQLLGLAVILTSVLLINLPKYREKILMSK